MKKNICTIAIYFVLVNITLSQIQLEWASSEDFGAIIHDDQGNYYTTGNFLDTLDFNLGAGTLSYTSNGIYDIFVAKYTSGGNLIWCKSFGGTGYDIVSALTIDGNNNVCLTGYFTETVDFDPGPNVYNLTSANSFGGFVGDVFILKLDENGNFLWAKANNGSNHSVGRGITTDLLGNVYITGEFKSPADFDPGPGVLMVSPYVNYNDDYFVQKLDSNGDLLWAKGFGGAGTDKARLLAIDSANNLYVAGEYTDSMDFDPGTGVYTLGTNGGSDCFIQKIAPNGDLLWAKGFGGTGNEAPSSLKIDASTNIYLAGGFQDTIDFNPGLGTHNLSTNGPNNDIFIQKLDSAGNFLWANKIGGPGNDAFHHLALDNSGDLYLSSRGPSIDCDPGPNTYTLPDGGVLIKLDSSCNLLWALSNPSGLVAIDNFNNIHISSGYDMSVDYDPSDEVLFLPTPINGGAYPIVNQKFKQHGIFGKVYNDFNLDCIKDSVETGLANKRLIIMPANIIVETNANGIWALDSLPAGTYNVIADTIAQWLPSCPLSQTFTVVHPDSITQAPNFGFYSTTPCAFPNVSINAPFLRPGFSDQRVYLQVCNHNFASGILDTIDLIVTLDSLLTPQNSSTSYVSLGNNQYKFSINTIFPGFCTNHWIDCNLSTSATIGQSLCLKAEISPVDICYLDSIPLPSPTGISPCQTVYDGSHLEINSWCNNDTILFDIKNIGSDMTCFSQVRLYVDGNLTLTDSILLLGSNNQSFSYSGDGRTWRMEIDQHPLHPGNSQPSSTIELCGNATNWTSNLVNILPQDDFDPFIDISCGLVTGSFDPNDKTGFPLGIGNTHEILPNQELEYLIRFQNTGTDTAFTVIIRDTLSTDLDAFSVATEVASHNFTFKMYGPRVLEWTFHNIMLPDSNVNEIASHGFAKFKVNQNINLPLGTVIQNSASIYFDYNLPIITNTYLHTIAIPQVPSWTTIDSISTTTCDSFVFNGVSYVKSGSYLHPTDNNGLDSLYSIDLTILKSSIGATLNAVSCNSYTAIDGQTYTSSGQYTALLSNNSVGCDSSIILNLTINNNDSIINETACESYTAPDGQTYTSSGQYVATIPNFAGCDSTITINLTINSSSLSAISDTTCGNYTAPDGQVYTSSGQYTAIIPNVIGCDSVITIDLIINSTISNTTSFLNENVCDSFIAPNGQLYTTSGQYVVSIPNSVGCDSIITINLSVGTGVSSSSTINETGCSSYTAPDGQVYTSSGQYIAVIPNAVHCDSTITINLVLTNTSSTIAINETNCSYTAPDGQVYTSSGQYIATISNTVGCDSIITINLTLPSSTSVLNDSTCASFYIAPDLQWYFATGQYTVIIPNAVGCDSIITLNLTFNQNSSDIINEISCASYTAPDGQIHTTSGQYTATIPNTTGCDSTITINLTIDNLPSDSIIQLGTTLTTFSSGMNYQWLDCNNGNSPINGATNQSFTPVVNGDYAVQITNGSCSTTSNCTNVVMLNLDDLSNTLNIKVYPNPTNSILYLKKESIKEFKLKLRNQFGQLLISQFFSESVKEINLSYLPAGLYYLSITNNEKTFVKKIVKK